MGYFWLGLFVWVVAFSYGVYFFCNRRAEPILISPWEWIVSKRYWFYAVWVVFMLSYLWALKTPLWRTVGCQYDGHSRSVETKYDWIKSICYFKTKSGTWMPLNLGRDSAEDNNHNQIPDSQEQQNEQ